MLKNPHDFLVHLTDLDNGRNPDTGTLKNTGGTSFSVLYRELQGKILVVR